MKNIVSSVLALSVLAFVLSCNDNNTTNPTRGFFLIANVSADAPPLNVTSNGSDPVASELAFGKYTPYYNVDPGTYNFSFIPTGTSTPVLTSNLNIEANKVYSYFVIDSFSKVKAAIVEDIFRAPPGDSVYVRFFNFSPNLPQPVSLIDSASGTTLATPFSNRTFNDQQGIPAYANFTEIPSGNYTLELKMADGTILSSDPENLQGGRVYTLFAKGFYTGTGTQVFGLGQILNYAQ